MWTRSPSGGRGPAPTYSLEQIADAAIAIADEHGLDGVTMRRVAAALGAGAMSLYRYVSSKDALFALMADRLLGREEWPELSGDWRKDLATTARDQRATTLAHPWALGVWGGRPGLGPNMMRGFERTMSVVDGLGLSLDDMLEVVGLLNTWVQGYVRHEIDERDFAVGSDVAGEQAWGEYVAALVAGGEHPYFTRVVAEARSPHIDADARFERALERLLSGIEATLPG